MTADHQPVLTPLPAGLFATGAGAGLATALTGVWLMTAPFATGYQPADAEWVDATRVGVWTGVLLVLGGLAVTGMFAGALREELRRRGLRPAAAEPTDRRLTSATSPDGPGGSADGDLGRVLAPLAAALLADLQAEQVPAGHRSHTHDDDTVPPPSAA